MQKEILYSFFGTPYTMGLVKTNNKIHSYKVPNKNKTAFYAVYYYPNCKGFYQILKYDLNACQLTTAWIDCDGFLMIPTPNFKSFIRAVAWMKKYVNELI